MTRDELLKIAKPILFNTEMVRAILDGRKTETRRCVKFKGRKNPNWTGYVLDGLTLYNDNNEICNKKLPFKPGDILYVRETWYKDAGRYLYRANYADNEKFYIDGHEIVIKWHPSIHMLKEAARIFLKVTDVRVERLQRCGEGLCVGIENEGVITPLDPILYISDDEYHNALRRQFILLWDSTIPRRQLDTYGWDANPWVWVIEFERIEPDDERRIV